jgi:transposase
VEEIEVKETTGTQAQPPLMYIGVDVAKEQLVSALLAPGQTASWPMAEVGNDKAGFEALAKHVNQACAKHGLHSQKYTLRLIVEPTGGYERRLVYWAHARGWEVVLVNTKQVHDWVKGKGQRAKTDALDAQMLASFAAEPRENKPLPLWIPMPETIARLDALMDRRRDLERMLRQEHNRDQMSAGQPGLDQAVSTSLSAIMAALLASLAEIECAVEELTQEHPDIQEQIDQLDSIPGVGDKTVLPLFVLLARWHTMTGGLGSPKALAAFVGLDAKTHDSGKSKRRGGISKTGDPEMRASLYMAALGGKRGKGANPLRDFFDRLVKRGKPKKVALVAAARKILMWAWAVFCTHTYFDPNKCVKGA